MIGEELGPATGFVEGVRELIELVEEGLGGGGPGLGLPKKPIRVDCLELMERVSLRANRKI